MAAGVDEGIPTTTAMLMEPRPFRPFKTSEEYLWAMKEDLAEWLNSLYNLDTTAENFLERLETGETLCRHANRVRQLAIAQHSSRIAGDEVVHRCGVAPGTFHARDNISNFIRWCRGLGVMECLLFETDDLVLRKNERSFILCLLEIARRGAKLGMPAPTLVQMEEEIEREILKDIHKKEMNGLDYDGDEDDDDSSPPLQIITNDLKSLDEMVRDLVNRCLCPVQFPMIRVSEGKYRIGDTQTLIFVRILRSHVMVRVGGGWDTLEHYLDKHDPCRCRQGHRSTVSSRFTIKHSPSNSTNPYMQVTYERTPENYNGILKDRMSPSQWNRVRRASLSSNPSVASKSSTGSLTSNASDKERHRKSVGDGVGTSHLNNANSRRLSDGDVYFRSGLDHLDEGYHSGPKLREKSNQRVKTTETNGNRKENSDCSSGVSTDHEAKPGSPDSNEPDHDRKRRGSNAPLNQALEAINRLSRKKSQSTEELGGPATLSIPPSASSQTLRRTSLGKASGIPVHMTRSRSQYSEDSDMARYTNRATRERLSYRSPRSGGNVRGLGNTSNTWSCRPRSARPALNGDTFGRPPANQSPSPQRRSRSGPARTETLHITPNRTVLPLVQEVLSAAGSQDQLLRKMAELVAQHKPEKDASPVLPNVEDPGYHYTSDWVAATANRNRRSSGTSRSSPVEDSGSEAGDSTWRDSSGNTGPYANSNGQSRIPVRVNPRKDSTPGSTRIPVPTFYSY